MITQDKISTLLALRNPLYLVYLPHIAVRNQLFDTGFTVNLTPKSILPYGNLLVFLRAQDIDVN